MTTTEKPRKIAGSVFYYLDRGPCISIYTRREDGTLTCIGFAQFHAKRLGQTRHYTIRGSRQPFWTLADAADALAGAE